MEVVGVEDVRALTSARSGKVPRIRRDARRIPVGREKRMGQRKKIE
jgi:hypothetical protein